MIRDWLRDQIEWKCIEYGDFKGKTPGSSYDWVLDIRRALLDPAIAFGVSKLMIEKMRELDPQFNFQVCCREQSPLGMALSLSAKYFGVNLNVILCRKEKRAYGLENRFEGTIEDKVTLIVDEMSNHGRNMQHCFDALMKEGISPATVAMTVVNKSNNDAERDRYLPNDVRVISLFNLNDFDLSIGSKKRSNS